MYICQNEIILSTNDSYLDCFRIMNDYSISVDMRLCHISDQILSDSVYKMIQYGRMMIHDIKTCNTLGNTTCSSEYVLVMHVGQRCQKDYEISWQYIDCLFSTLQRQEYDILQLIIKFHLLTQRLTRQKLKKNYNGNFSILNYKDTDYENFFNEIQQKC